MEGAFISKDVEDDNGVRHHLTRETYVLTPFGAESPNYTISYQPGTLTVIRTALPGYSGALNYVSNVAGEDLSEPGDNDVKRPLFQIQGSGMRLPDGVR